MGWGESIILYSALIILNALREKSSQKDKQNIISAKATEKTPALKIVVLEDTEFI